MKAQLLFATLPELVKRKTSFEKKLDVIFNGDENDYAERVERLIDNSITGKQCRKLFRQYLTGRGFGEDLNKVIVNKDKGTTLFKFLSRFDFEYATHGGVFVHVMHNLAGEPVSFDVVPYTSIRLGKKDGYQWNGKFYKANDWPKAKKKDLVAFHAFNPDPKIVQENIKDSGKLEKYKGQIYFFNPSDQDYPLAHIHPVLNDCDSEFRAGVFKNKSLRKGFFGKNILVTPPRIDPFLAKAPEKTLTADQILQLRKQEELADEVTDALKGFVGVENHEGFMTLEMEFEGDSIEKAIKHVKIDTDIDDKLFAHTEDSTSNNIRKAYNNVPKILLDTSDHALFSQSGEAIKAAKEFYQDQCEEEQMLIEHALAELFTGFGQLKGKELKIQPLVVEEEVEETPRDVNAEAQATLRGSVGGVTALLQVQQSVAAGTTDVEAAVAIIREIFGFEESIAREMLGNPQSTNPNTQ